MGQVGQDRPSESRFDAAAEFRKRNSPSLAQPFRHIRKHRPDWLSLVLGATAGLTIVVGAVLLWLLER